MRTAVMGAWFVAAALQEALEPGSTVKDGLGIEWRVGPFEGSLGSVAKVDVGEDFLFTSSRGTQKLLQAWGNITSGTELGTVTPTDPEAQWHVIFEFKKVGYVKDDEELDADELLEQLQDGQEQANEELERRNLEPLEVVRWTTPPHYDAASHNLEWGLLLQSPSGQSVNYNIKLLGRSGVMEATLVCDPADVEAALPESRKALEGFTFTEGNTYGEWKQGDPIAEYGLTGLVLGGAAVAAWKFGILGKLLKFAKFIAVAVLVGIGGIWKWLTGRKKAA